MHFTTAREAYLKGPPVPGCEAVTIRIISLPLKTAVDSPGIFPSHFNQMRAITDNSSSWATYPVYDERTWMLQMLAKRREISMNTYPWTYGTLVRLTERVNKMYTTEHAKSLEETRGWPRL
ncbi:hypothetical protein FALCPG4_015024 [Fusarium falciforme]